MKTPLQELISRLEFDLFELQSIRVPTITVKGKILGVKRSIEKAKELLEVQKHMMMISYSEGVADVKLGVQRDSETWFNEQFKNPSNEND
tara:strand:+ start:4371 stop:4640 length:270 start_codon:yes stop_codon:yes gene_type:complete